MVTKAISIEVPEGGDFAGIEQAIADEIEDQTRKTLRAVEYQHALTSDEALDRWLKKDFNTVFGQSRLPPVVRAGVYEKIQSRFQELFPPEYWSDPRRPVIMRGSLYYLKNKYERKSALHEAIIDRFIRFKKITAYTFEEFDKQIGGARKKLWGKYIVSYRQQYRYWDFGHSSWSDTAHVLVDGEWKYIPVAQYAKLMQERNMQIAKAAEKASREAKARVEWQDFMLRKETAKTAKTAKIAAERRARRARELAVLEIMTENKLI